MEDANVRDMNKEGIAASVSIPLESDSGKIDPDSLFGRVAPLEVDLGSGTGSFLVGMAGLFPERNFLGAERLLNRVAKTCRAVTRSNLANVRMFKGEIGECLRALPAHSADVLHVLFPDPWPKRRHHPRRLMNDVFLRAAWDVLKDGGELRFMTDDENYFLHARKVSRTHPYVDGVWPEDPVYPATDFEVRFLAEGRPFYRLCLRKDEGERSATSKTSASPGTTWERGTKEI